MEINNALFAANGGCGYVLKPERFRSIDPVKISPKKLRIVVLSAQQLVRSKEKATTSTKSAVTVEVIGDPKDTAKQKSQVVKSNGFNPIFNKEFVFNIMLHDLCFLRFNVEDMDGLTADTFGSYIIAFSCLECGKFFLRQAIVIYLSTTSKENVLGFRHYLLMSQSKMYSNCIVINQWSMYLHLTGFEMEPQLVAL